MEKSLAPPPVWRTLFAPVWLRRLVWAAVAVLGLGLLGWLAVPPVLKWQLQKQGSALLGRAVTVERVDFAPWALALTLEGLRVADATGRGNQLLVQRVFVDVSAQSLLRLAPVVDALTVEQPRVWLRHLGGGRYDVDDVLQRLAQPEDETTTEPAQFALFNVRLSGGEVVLTDDSQALTHRLSDLVLTLPFLSNLPAQREVRTQPQLAFVLNGNAFDSSADTKPFAQSRETEARLRLPALDVAPYLPYWPALWPVKPVSGVLHLDLTLAFEQGTEATDPPRVALSGALALSGVRLVAQQAAGAPELTWLAFDRLGVVLNRLEPLAQRLDVASVQWQGPRLGLVRDGAGRINLQQYAAAWAALHPTAPEAAPALREPAGPGWDVRVGRVAIEQAGVVWRDAAVRPAVQLALDDLNLSAEDLRWPVQAPVPFRVSARLGETPLSLQGSASPNAAQVQWQVDALPLGLAAPYWAQVLQPALGGRLSAQGELDWQAAQGQQPMALVLRAPSVQLDQLTLGPARAPHASWQRLQIQALQADWAARRVGMGALVLTQPRAQVLRAVDGRWMFEHWFKTAAAKTPVKAAEKAPAAQPWQLALNQLTVQDGRLAFEDRLPQRPVALSVTGIRLQLKHLKPLDRQQKAMPLSLQLRLGFAANALGMPAAQTSQADPGRLALSGSLRLPGAGAADAGLQLRSHIDAERLPLHALEPYFGDRLNLDLLRADASYRGTLQLALPAQGLSLGLAGDAALEDFRANTLSPSEELLAWKALNVRGLELALAPGQATRLVVGETVLSDYFARVILSEAGRLNLQGLVKPDDQPAPATTETGSAAATQTATETAAAPPNSAAPADIRFGPVSLVNGRVFFSDRFIQPNYSANLTELSGGLSAFANNAAVQGGPPPLADLSLRGRAEGTAALEIAGRLNPLAQPLALDIQGRVRDLELPPLSPYAVKYAGHGIERGKLSVDVAYRVAPDGQLSASNQVVLNQLRFGERAPDSEAPKLPVKLAVALLADRNGVIDINLPISGSISDPQFRIGPILWRVVLNLVGKAITSPFSLLASAFGGGGGDEMSQVAFEPGSAQLSDEARQRLDAVAKALSERPALQLTVVGHSDLETERSDVQRARLAEQVLAEKRRQLAREGASVSGPLVVSPAEYPALLKSVYQRADIPKPRNLVGMAKDIPQADMEALLLAATVVSADTMRELAVARSVAVKDHLASRNLPEDRMFLGAPQPLRQGERWVPQAELKLAPR
jgi:uncharacterized protein involved in outer membrane biogenesis